jgi:hypothetical protein
MPGPIRPMHLEHVFRNVQTDRGSLLQGRPLRWQFDTVTLARGCRPGASTPSPYSVDPDGYWERQVWGTDRTRSRGSGRRLCSLRAQSRCVAGA